MATFKIVLDKRKKFEKDKFHLSVRVSKSRDITYLHLGQLMTPKEYDIYFRKQAFDKNILAVKERFESYANRAHMVYQIVVPYDKVEFRKIFYDKDYNFDKHISQEDKETGTMKFLFKNCIKGKLESNIMGLSTSHNYITALNNIEKFQAGLTYKEITSDLLYKLEGWYLSQKTEGKTNSIASVGNLFRCLKSVLKYNIKKRFIPPTFEYPFNDYKIPTYTPAKKVITIEEIKKIVDLKEFDNDCEWYARDIWLLLYRMNGINFVDLLKLKWSDKKGDYFEFFRHKTIRTRRSNIRPIKIKITDKIQEILDRIGDKDSPFVIGKISSLNYTESYLVNRNRKVKAKVNKYLKVVGNRLNLSMSLDVSLARDCYANTLKRSGVNALKISENMNHSDPRTTTLHYLDNFEQEDLDKANDYIL
jgi:integrase